jgi:hypothetical protein
MGSFYDLKPLIKSQMTEAFAMLLLERGGYSVVKYGVEEKRQELKAHPKNREHLEYLEFISGIEPTPPRGPSEEEMASMHILGANPKAKPNEVFSARPDLLVFDFDVRTPTLLEVKFRRNFRGNTRDELVEKLIEQREIWPRVYFLLMLGHCKWNPDSLAFSDHVRIIGPDFDLDSLRSTPGITDIDIWKNLKFFDEVFPRISEDYQDFNAFVPLLRTLGDCK